MFAWLLLLSIFCLAALAEQLWLSSFRLATLA